MPQEELEQVPQPTPEELAEQDILAQPDAIWFRMGSASNPYGYTEEFGVESASLGKRVRRTNHFEDKIVEGKKVGEEVRMVTSAVEDI